MNNDASSTCAPTAAALQAKRLRAFSELGLGLPLQARQAMNTDVSEETEAVQATPVVPDEPFPPSGADRQPMPVEAAPAPAETEFSTPVWRADFQLADTLEGLSEQVASCQACGLCKTRTQTVFAAGNAQADLAIVGEAPGAEEDRTGLAFVGNAGKLLDNMLGSLELKREQHAYICNVIKCRPPGNRDPLPEEVAKCEPYLQQQLALVRPRIILVVGRFAAQSLLQTDASIASLRGKVHAYQVAERRIPVVVTYHPAYLLRNLADKSKAWSDLCLLKSEMERPA